MKLILVFFSFTLMLVPKIGIGQTSSELDAVLQNLATTFLQKCPGLTELANNFEAQGKTAEAFSVRAGMKNYCECMPREIAKLRQSNNWKKLKEKFSESEFNHLFRSSVLDKCAAEQFRSTFDDGCTHRLPSSQPNREKYCACMREKFALFPDSEIADLGISFSDYIPKAAEAKKNGVPPPTPSPHVKRFFSIDETCKSNQQ